MADESTNEDGLLVPLGFEEAEGSQEAQKNFDEGGKAAVRGFANMKTGAIALTAALGGMALAAKKVLNTMNDLGETSLGVENMGAITGFTAEEMTEQRLVGAQTGIADLDKQMAVYDGFIADLKDSLKVGKDDFNQYQKELAIRGINIAGLFEMVSAGDSKAIMDAIQAQAQAQGLEEQDLMSVLKAANLEGMFNLFNRSVSDYNAVWAKATSEISEETTKSSQSFAKLAIAVDVFQTKLSDLTLNTLAPFAEKLEAGVNWMTELFGGGEEATSPETIIDEQQNRRANAQRNRGAASGDSEELMNSASSFWQRVISNTGSGGSRGAARAAQKSQQEEAAQAAKEILQQANITENQYNDNSVTIGQVTVTSPVGNMKDAAAIAKQQVMGSAIVQNHAMHRQKAR